MTPDSTNPKDLIGVTKSSLRFVPPALAIGVAPVMALGAKKYAPYNWRSASVKMTVYLEAILRHLYAVMDGEWLDPESGEPHVAHIGANVGILLDARELGVLIDDRPTPGPAAEMLAAQDHSGLSAEERANLVENVLSRIPAPEDALPWDEPDSEVDMGEGYPVYEDSGWYERVYDVYDIGGEG